jgi:alkanesulfonate monooxygenase SsuD/methylene tetrahydromethanopterin reductase-like flavin-dependent oxidoreductase (luciferase family)
MELGVLSLGDHLPDPATGERHESAATRHQTIVEGAVLAEALGFDSVWLGEHHFCDYVVSAPPIVLAAIAARTEQIRLGTGVTLLANLDPVRVAEDYATLDGLSNGRVELVAGRGILTETYQAFGQAPEESRPRFRENLELLLTLWREEDVSWSGSFRAPLEKVTVQPRPVQMPHPPVWVAGGSSETSVDLAAELGLPLMLPSVLAAPEAFAPLVERYHEGLVAAGHDAACARVGAVSHVHVRATSQEARSFWEPYYRNYFEFLQRLWVRQELVGRSVKIDFDYDRLLQGPGVCGSPAEVADRLASMQERLGLDVHLAMFDLGGLPRQELFRALELYGREVAPALRPL